MIDTPFTWRVLRRRGWLLVVGTAVGIAAAWVLSGIAVSASGAYSVDAVEAGTPYQSGRLALTYAQLLPESPSLLRTIESSTGLSEQYVRDHLTMSAEPETNILFARFSAKDGQTGRAALDALNKGLGGESDSAGSKLRTTMTPISSPTNDGGFSRSRAIALGAVLGLLVAGSIALAWERRFPRVDDLRDLVSILPLPASRVTEATLPSALSSLRGSSGSMDLVVRVVGRRRAGPSSRPTPDIAAEGAAGEPDSSRDGRCALVVGQGARAAEVEEAWELSLASGAGAVAALLVGATRSPLRLPRLR